MHLTVEFTQGQYRAISGTDGPNVGTMTTADFEKRFAKEKEMAGIIDYMYRNGYELLTALPTGVAGYQLIFFNKKAD